MLDCTLFLGLRVDPSLHAEIQKKPPQFQSLFIQDHSDYLQRVEHQGDLFIGKFIGEQADVPSLPLLEVNIFSLLRLLAPLYSFNLSSLELFPIIKPRELSR